MNTQVVSITTNSQLETKGFPRPAYKLLLSAAFAINTDHAYSTYVHHVAYAGNFNLFLMFLGALLKWIDEKNVLSLDMGLELTVYACVGLIQSLMITSLLFNKNAIESTFRSMQITFVRWSLKRRVYPDNCYDKNNKYLLYSMIGMIACVICVMIGPVLSAIHDIGNVPLDHRSHWILHWPSLIHMESFWSYGFIFTLQVISSTYTLLSITLHNLYMVVFLTEVKEQFNLLASEIRQAFNYRMDQHFQDCFVDCVRHHQTLIKALEEFKKYYKWILLGEVVAVQLIFSIVVYCLLKVDASFGYKLKFFGILVLRIAMVWFQCTLGDDMTHLHKSMATELYDMTWYRMPSQYKKMIIIMFQRSQKDLAIHIGPFKNKVASRIMFIVIIKQFYTFLNVLLNI